jgi:glycosyltransferase involved in cell wall biosynthesis
VIVTSRRGVITRPRALIIVENAPVPGDRRVWHESLSLRRAGWDVTVLAPHAAREPRRPDDELIEGIRIRRFRLQAAEQSRLGHIAEYTVAMWRIRRELRELAREGPFAAIQACNPPDFLLLAAIGQRRRGARLLFDHHDLSPEMYASRSTRSSAAVVRALLWFERLGLSLADVVMVTNESAARILIERDGKDPADVFVVRNGPMLDRFGAVEPDPTLARGRPHLLLYVGLMGPQDGVDHALRALSQLASRRRDWHALFLGDGEELPALRTLSTQLGLDEHVEFGGYVADAELRRAICSADICLAPDPRTPYSDRATLVKLAEYMALSRPVVSYDLTESRVTAGDAALFAGNNDPAEFAQRIEELLDDPDLRTTLGARGRGRVERELAWECSERALLAAYQHPGHRPRNLLARLRAGGRSRAPTD